VWLTIPSILFKEAGCIAVCHLATTKALSLAGAWPCLERVIFNAFSVSFSNYVVLINEDDK